jgi:acyl-CoA thioester hydrolase
MSSRPTPEPRSAYAAFQTIPTRWMDNDLYGHVNNAVYHFWFDTAVNTHLIEHGVLDIHAGDVIGFIVENHCNYFAPVAYPQTIEAGIRVASMGKSSVRYEIGLFIQGDASNLTIAKGYFVHVYVKRETQQPTTLPDNLRLVLEKLCK